MMCSENKVVSRKLNFLKVKESGFMTTAKSAMKLSETVYSCDKSFSGFFG